MIPPLVLNLGASGYPTGYSLASPLQKAGKLALSWKRYRQSFARRKKVRIPPGQFGSEP